MNFELDGKLTLEISGKKAYIHTKGRLIRIEADQPIQFMRHAGGHFAGIQTLRMLATACREAGFKVEIVRSGMVIASLGYDVEADVAAKMLGVASARLGNARDE